MIPKRAISPARSAAARANGAKSRGPVSTTGRASARNSLRHGLRARTLTANDPKFETDYNRHLTNRIAEAPESTHLFVLFQTLAWGHRRT
jgi:hypothetical protein